MTIACAYPDKLAISQVGPDWTGAALFVQNDAGKFDVSTAFVDAKGKRAFIADEIFWNQAAPTGEALTKLDKAFEDMGFTTGLVITPAVFINIDWVNGTSTFKTAEEFAAIEEALRTEVAKVDFVAVDPYKGLIPGVSDEWLLAFTRVADEWIHAQGKEAHLVVQGFARHGDEQATLDFITKQLAGNDYDEVIVFGLEDAHDLSSIDFVGINPLPILDGGI